MVAVPEVKRDRIAAARLSDVFAVTGEAFARR
jgi:hypothetical protein